MPKAILRRTGSKRGDPIDVFVGGQIRRFRLIAGLSQTALADKLGISFQQIQKYEKGYNRIAPSKLSILAHMLDVDITAFFPPRNGSSHTTKADDLLQQLGQTRSGIALARAFLRLNDDAARNTVIAVAEALAPK
jgi:transcriptional regulator with XRE-family HTH domain